MPILGRRIGGGECPEFRVNFMYFIRDNPGIEKDEPCRPIEQIALPTNEDLIDHRWKTETVIGIAEAIRESKDFSVLPILADALQDAGCENRYILNHCRLIQQHDSECWVISAVFMPSNEERIKREEEFRAFRLRFDRGRSADLDSNQTYDEPRDKFSIRMLRLLAFWSMAIFITIVFEIIIAVFLFWLIR